ncbi:cell wall hydrolase [Salipiger abyssi]|uniref:cell wall hydrolase n=1 Tax=Salipiger abyssi TaxID=1250539 RepID=UPI001A8C9633|nr:cell wall hydrolase [Salipiger abyssi]MBN9888665.1 cell wall hydrolase [Salipiger abyssi]
MPLISMTRTAALALPLLVLLAACGARMRHHPDELECMERAMYFESHRSSRDGLIAVGSVVMNRVASDDFPGTVCGVVSQKNQFAPGVMTREMTGASTALVREAALSVLHGERHPMIADARFFHSSSYRASYNNMHYVLSTGGNAFYEKRRPEAVTQPYPPLPIEGITGL